MTSTISEGVKVKLKKVEFNYGYLMLLKIIAELQSIGDAKFMRLTKKYYIIDYIKFITMLDYLTHIKLLEKRIKATKVTFDDDKQTLLCLAMSLSKDLQYLTKI